MTTDDMFGRIREWDTATPNGKSVVPPPEIVGFCISVARGLNNWKQTTLADFASVSLSTVERIERGENISIESLERIGKALGYESGYFTEPRRRRSQEEALEDLSEKYGHLEAVAVEPFRKQRQVRELAGCSAFLVHAPGLESDCASDIRTLREWLDLVGFIRATPKIRRGGHGQRLRKRYRDVLGYVSDLERRGINVLAGVLNAPQPGLPNWSVAVVSLSPKQSDPGASKRRYIFIDRRVVALPGYGHETESAEQLQNEL